MKLTLELDRETDGRWIAEVPELPGVIVYGETKDAAVRRAATVALEVLAEMIENGELELSSLAAEGTEPRTPSALFLQAT